MRFVGPPPVADSVGVILAPIMVLSPPVADVLSMSTLRPIMVLSELLDPVLSKFTSRAVKLPALVSVTRSVTVSVFPSKVSALSAFIASVPVAVTIRLSDPFVMKSDTSTLMASAATSIPVPAPTLRVTPPLLPPPVRPSPAVTPVMSPVATESTYALIDFADASVSSLPLTLDRSVSIDVTAVPPSNDKPPVRSMSPATLSV